VGQTKQKENPELHTSRESTGPKPLCWTCLFSEEKTCDVNHVEYKGKIPCCRACSSSFSSFYRCRQGVQHPVRTTTSLLLLLQYFDNLATTDYFLPHMTPPSTTTTSQLYYCCNYYYFTEQLNFSCFSSRLYRIQHHHKASYILKPA
jgi:hypothetical protein